MNNVKRLSLALVALGLSAPAFADSSVLVPSQHGGLKVGVDALYLRPTNTDLNYATNVSFPSNFTTGFEHNNSVDPSYDWGFYAQVGYLFPCTGNDLTLGYTYLRSDETDSVVAAGASSGATSNIPFVGVHPMGLLFVQGFDAAEGKAKFDLNVVDLEGGQRFTTGAYDMRMFAGLRYADIDHQLQTAAVFASPATEESTIAAQQFKSQFTGIGPRLGVDGRYCLSSGFGIDANLSTALLIGHVDGRYNAVESVLDAEGTATDSQFESKNGSEKRLVPVLEAKLGVDYTYIMDCRCKSSLTFEAGYQATNYFNAVDHARVTEAGNSIGNVISQNSTSDVGFDGIYLGVKYYA